MTVDRTPSTINKLKKAREVEEERRRIRALAKAKADAIAEERARLEEAQRVIHVNEDEAVDALSAGLTRQSLLEEDASQDGLTAEQTIAKLLVVVKNQEMLMRSELEKKRELQSLRESMQHSEAEKWELPLTAKSQQFCPCEFH
jgi:alanyl-tRNA synthetase